jgi:hypothetical protein
MVVKMVVENRRSDERVCGSGAAVSPVTDVTASLRGHAVFVRPTRRVREVSPDISCRRLVRAVRWSEGPLRRSVAAGAPIHPAGQ